MEIATMTSNPMSFLPGMQSVDTSHLEYLGKQAAALAESGPLSLADATVQLLGSEKLGAEHVRRVVEFANTEAFNRKFSALDPSNRVVDIDGGPADPEQVIQTLNDHTRPQVVELQSMDYSMPPEPKVAQEIDLGFGAAPVEHTRGGTLHRMLSLQSKLSGAHEETVHSAESARFQMVEAVSALQGVVKSAGLMGLHQEDLAVAWLRASPDLAKQAMSYMPALPSRGQTKVAHQINPAHPVVTHYLKFTKQAENYAAYTTARQNLERRLVEVGAFLERHRS